MQKTGIEYLDFVYNSVKGRCPNTDCPIYQECYMKRPPSCWSVNKKPKLHLDMKTLLQKPPRKPSRIGVGFNIELFHPKVPSEWIQNIIYHIIASDPDQIHRWLFLTKCPARYAEFDFPKNCWLGVTVTRCEDQHQIMSLAKLTKNLTFVSCEPLLGELRLNWQHWETLKWVIVGAMTGSKAKKYQPYKEWVEYLKCGCYNWKIPIFLKNNLAPVWGDKLIQEFPHEGGCPDLES